MNSIQTGIDWGDCLIFGKTVEIRYNSKGAYAICSYKENEEFLNALFDELKHMSVSDYDGYNAYFLEPIIRRFFKKKAYRDFVRFLSFNGFYSDSIMSDMVTNPSMRTELQRISAVACAYRFS